MDTGWSIEKIAATWNQLMLRLDYDSYFAQGGDWGAAVTAAIGMQNLGNCQAIHLNMVIVEPDPATMDDLSPLEQSALAGMQYYQDHDSGYSKQQSCVTTNGGLRFDGFAGRALINTDAVFNMPTSCLLLTPWMIGQMTWIVEKYWAWMDCDGHPENVLSKDELLDNVMLYWCTASAASSARLYWESFNDLSREEVALATGCSVYPTERKEGQALHLA